MPPREIHKLEYDPRKIGYAALHHLLSHVQGRKNALLTAYTKDGAPLTKYELTERLEEEILRSIAARYIELLFEAQSIPIAIIDDNDTSLINFESVSGESVRINYKHFFDQKEFEDYEQVLKLSGDKGPDIIIAYLPREILVEVRRAMEALSKGRVRNPEASAEAYLKWYFRRLPDDLLKRFIVEFAGAAGEHRESQRLFVRYLESYNNQKSKE